MPFRQWTLSVPGNAGAEAAALGDKVPESASAAPPPRSAEPRRGKRPRVDWAALQRHTFGCDVWQCPCGGRRRVVAVVTGARAAEEALRNMGLWQPEARLPPAQAPPQRELVLEA